MLKRFLVEDAPRPLRMLTAFCLMAGLCAAGWEDHTIRQLNGHELAQRLPARYQVISLPWGRMAQMPYVIYMPEKDELLMLVLSERPTRAMLTRSSDRGKTWSIPEHPHRGADGKPDIPGSTCLTYLGGGKVIMVAAEGTLDSNLVSDDFGHSWSKVPRPQAFPGQPLYVWDPFFAEPAGRAQRMIETGYVSVGKWEELGYSQGVIRFSQDGGQTWSATTRVPEWRRFNEIVVARATNGDLIAACRSDAPERFHKLLYDNYSGLGVSISKDEGRTWSPVNMLFEWGRHHPSMVVLPTGDIVMSYAVRRGYPNTPDGFAQMGIEAVVSRDNGRTWDLDHRYLLTSWRGLVNGPDGPYIAQSQSTSSLLLPDGSILTAYGGAERAIRTKPGESDPRDVGLINWSVNPASLNSDRTIASAPFNSDLRNRFDLNRLNGVPGKVNIATPHADVRVTSSLTDLNPSIVLQDDSITNLLTLRTIPAWIELRWNKPHRIDEVRIHPGAPATARLPETECVPLGYRLQFEKAHEWVDLIPPVQNAPRYRDFDAKMRNPMILEREFEYVHSFPPTSVTALRLFISRTSDGGRRKDAPAATLVPESNRETILREIEVFEARSR